jgi:cytochrome c
MENDMKPHAVFACLSMFTTLVAFSLPSGAAGVDADAAKALAKESGCLTCHSVNKTKTGPSYQKVAAAMKGKADAEKKLTEFITTGPKINVGGSEAEHPVINTKDPKQIKNLVDWILAQ